MSYYRQNEDITYAPDSYVDENSFIGSEQESVTLPKFDEVKERLPRPIWDGHDDAIDAYYGAWKIAFSNIANPEKESAFITPFIDTAFNGNLFMWDSCFIMMFAKYARSEFDFQKTLDNFYALQHKDGFICRELREKDGRDRFVRFDPSATGPEIMAWCEWEYYLTYRDTKRLEKVFAPLMAFHNWMRQFRTWQDGSYWGSGFSCGMDNSPRVEPGYNEMFSHGHMVWADICFQAILDCRILIKIAKELGRENEIAEIKKEEEFLTKYVNEKLWDEKTEYYYDLWRNGELNGVKSIGSYWALLSGAVPAERQEGFIQHLENPAEFKSAHRVPTLSMDHPLYNPDGGYWRGSVWAPTNYMVLKGLNHCGREKLAYEIALNHLENTVACFNETGTYWENYAPNGTGRGCYSKDEFVGWSGIIPISVLIEYVLGIKAEAENDKIVWNVNRTERHGIENYPFKDTKITLICEERENAKDKPVIKIISERPVTVECVWDGGRDIVSNK